MKIFLFLCEILFDNYKKNQNMWNFFCKFEEYKNLKKNE